MITREKVAPGHDNYAGLQAFREMSPPLFRRYLLATSTEWYESESRRSDANGFPKLIGLPISILVFTVLSQPEYQLLRALPEQVTYYGYNKTEAEWQYFNADSYLERLEPNNWRFGFWTPVRLRLFNLTEIDPPP